MKIRRINYWPWRLIAGVLLLSSGWHATANPTGMTVQSGSASPPAVNGSTLTITTSQSAFLNWKTFNIAAGETTIFNQPSAYSVVINNIHDSNASQIYGSLQANGLVVLMNASGFYFGPNAFVKTGGLIVSTANCIPPQNSGGSWQFNGPPPLKSIVNYGQIQVGQNGSAFLIADDVENHGSISAPGGTVGLASGQTVLLSERPDGRGMSMQVTLPQHSVNNYGTLTADAGTIEMNAQVVNQNGLIQANSVQNQNGVIELVASDQLNLGANSKISAHGDDSSAGSSGGSVTLQSGNNFSDSVGSQIDVSGGAQGGNGGNVEISAPNILSLNSSMNAGAQAGWSGGEFLLDPVNIVLGTSTAGGAINVNTAFAGFSQILLQASGTITLNAGAAWNLSASSGLTSGQLTLEAGGNIIFQNGSSISDGNNWSVALDAGYNFVNNTILYGQGSILLNGGNGSIQTSAGNINLEAGQNILVGSGYVITTGGGSVSAQALAGNIDTGSDAQGYFFQANASSLSQAYNLSDGLGGISTGAGGNVKLIAGGNVTSVLPVSVGTGKIGFVDDGSTLTSIASGHTDFSTAGSGAYGSQLGNVTIVAGGNVTGNYLVANGTGRIFAGVQMDANGNPVVDSSGNYVLGTSGSAGTDVNKNALALSLINGGWNVTAAQNIYLQEVRNPNGVFDTKGGTAYNHLFNYGLDDYVDLNAGNMVQLGASSSTLPRSTQVPVVYPSILNITAGDGGVILNGDSTYNQLILFPSPEGSLTINTTGSLKSGLPSSGGAPQTFNLIVSDSGKSQYKSSGDFGLNDHAATPVHLNSETPLELNIGGDMDFVLLGAPEAAQINVVGDMNNSRFQGMNLNPDDITSINVGLTAKENMENSGFLNPATDSSLVVGGDINNRSIFTDITGVTPEEAANLVYLSESVNNSISAATLASSFYYNPATQTLIYQNITGASLLNVLNLLNNLTVQEYINGVPQWENPPTPGGTPPFDTIPLPAPNTVSVFGNPNTPGTVAYALLSEYNLLGAIPNNATANGLIIGGGGTFTINAANMDLGTSAGIRSVGPLDDPALANYFLQGANINVNLTGNLDMFSTTISSLNGGDVDVNAGGIINVGSPIFTGNDQFARGIFTAAKSDVTVVAGGDINLNGSRIAAYDGGNVTVESLHGNIDAGSGANGYVNVEEIYVDPHTREIFTTTEAIPGSGILATTFPPPLPGSIFPSLNNVVGNILVEAPEGDINAGLGGIIQVPLNGVDSPNATVEVLSGYELRDAHGNRVLADNLANGTPVPVFDAQNVVSLGSTIQVTPAGTGTPVSLTQILDANGNPLLDSSGNPLYVKTLDASQQIVEFVGNKIQPYLNSIGNSVSVTEPLDASGHPYPNGQGDPILVLGRSIDIGGSGIIAQNAVLKATGGIRGVIFSAHNIVLDSTGPIIVIALGRSIQVNGPVSPISELIAPSVTAPTADPSTIQSQDANGGGSTFSQGTTANATSQAASNNNASQTTTSSDQDNDDDKKKKKEEVALAQKVSRVTVILPAKSPPPSSSQKQTSTKPL